MRSTRKIKTVTDKKNNTDKEVTVKNNKVDLETQKIVAQTLGQVLGW